jgi:flagellar biosynthesis protein FlhG
LEIDEKMTECIIEQTPIVIKYHNGKTAKQLIQIAAKLANQSPPEEPQGLWGIFTKLLKQR